MINHLWGLLSHPDQEWKQIQREHESVPHLYEHHVLLLAAIPVICTYFGTTHFGWTFGEGVAVKLSAGTALGLGALFYVMIIGAVALMGSVIHKMAKRFPNRPSRTDCIVFAGYIATPMFLSGLVAIYPLLWVCLLFGIVGLCYTTYLLYVGIPNFMNISREEGFILSSSTLAVGVLVLEALLCGTVLLWSYGPAMLS